MNAAELMRRILAYGADEAGIRDRFGDNDALYENCFRSFMEEPCFAELDEAIAAGDCAKAFEAAHALKGLSGNLGLSAFYTEICALVETLRAGRMENAAADYDGVLDALDALRHAVWGGPEPVKRKVERKPKKKPKKKAPEKRKPDAASEKGSPKPQKPSAKAGGKYLLLSTLTSVAALFLVGVLFFNISVTYHQNIIKESGQHLTETSNQIKLYVEERVANGWRIARSVGDSIIDSKYTDDDPAILGMLGRKREVWEVSNLILYTESGYCVGADGETDTNDVASDLVDRARDAGRLLSVVDSRLTYTVPLETELSYNGSPIAAVSVVQEMRTFLDDMDFTSLNEAAWMYLTEENGVVISALTSPYAMPAFNFKSVVRGTVAPLGEGYTADELFSTPATSPFLLTNDNASVYIVSVPILTGAASLRLFYLAPEKTVNNTMNGFSQQLTHFSLMMVGLFAILAALTFLIVYRSRKSLFDKAILARERMFDLLVKNTRTAFGLFTADRAEPEYASNNTQSVVGDRFWAIDRVGAGYRMRNSEGTDTPVMRQANEMLAGWDGRSVFKSGYIRADQGGAPYYFDYQLYPVDDGGEDFVGIAQDATQTCEREKATKDAMDMAQRANEAKSRFLSSMSHDIRTPMNAIINMTHFAMESVDRPEELAVCLRTIDESSEHLLHLINDVLDMSRIESGQMVVTSEPFDLRAELRRQADIVRPLCEAKLQTLTVDVDGVREGQVSGDALKLSQIMMNLLSNAVKFTPEGGTVRLSARELPSLRGDMVDVRFTVEDDGIGISEANLPHIFEPFRRADDRRVEKIEGTGLGLSICRSYVEAMGGTIRCESTEGVGSRFRVELFFAKAEGAPAPVSAPAAATGERPFEGLRCLVVEDNIINQTIAKTLLERVGFAVTLAGDGEEGVQMFLDAPPEGYDVIYMDIQMPVMDGHRAAAAIRASAHPSARSVPIVAMTANVFPEDVEKARVSGMDAYLGKPIVTAELVAQTRLAIARRHGGNE